MYITNPTKEQLSEWYECGEHVWRYLVYKKDLLNISKVKNKYYFAKTEELYKSLEDAPFWIKLIIQLL